MKIEICYTCDCGVRTVTTYTDALDEMFIECFICRSRRFRLTPVAGDGATATDGDVEGETRPAPEHDG